jgi:hypothetical protein
MQVKRARAWGCSLCFSDQAAAQEPPRAECQRDASFLRSNSFSAAVQLGILFARWLAGAHCRCALRPVFRDVAARKNEHAGSGRIFWLPSVSSIESASSRMSALAKTAAGPGPEGMARFALGMVLVEATNISVGPLWAVRRHRRLGPI